MSTTSHANAERAMGRTLSSIAMLHGAGEITWEQYQELLQILGRDKDLTPIDTGHIVGGLTSGNLHRLNSSEHGTVSSNLTTGTNSSTPLKSEKLDRRFLLFDLSPLDGAQSANTWGDITELERHKPVTETPPVSIPSTDPGPTSALGQQSSNITDAYLAPAPTNTPLDRGISDASSGISWNMEPLSASVTPTVAHFSEINPLMMTAPLSGCTKSGSNTPACGPEHNHHAYRTNSTADDFKGIQLNQTVQSTTRPMRIGDYSARDDPKRPSRSTKHASASPFSADDCEDRRQWATAESLSKLDIENSNSGTSSTPTAYSRQAHNWSNLRYSLSAEQAALSTDPTPTSKGKTSHPPKLITISDSSGTQVSHETIDLLVAEKYDSDAEDSPQTPYTIDRKGKDKERVRSRPPGLPTKCKVSKDTLVNDGGLSNKEGTAALPPRGFRPTTPRSDPALTIAGRHIPGTTKSHQWSFARSIRNPPQPFANFPLPPASTHHLIVCPYWWRSGTCPWKACPFQHREFDGAIIQRLMCPFWIGMRGPDGCKWRDEDCEFAHLDCTHGQWAHVSKVLKKREEYDN
ncbi:hypothetical protein SCUP234_03558 [Seiridium cupressi]